MDKNEITLLRVCCGAALISNIFTFLFAIHNSCRHLYRRKITKSLIIIFYLFLFLNSLANISMLLMIIIDPVRAIRDTKVEGEVRN